MNMDASGDNFKESNYKNLLQEIEYLVSSSKKKFFRATTKLKYINSQTYEGISIVFFSRNT